MDVAPDEPECPRGERSKRIQEHFVIGSSM